MAGTDSDAPRLRPGWMTVVAVICAATVVVSLTRDLLLPASRDVEVWFGFEITGPLAYATAIGTAAMRPVQNAQAPAAKIAQWIGAVA